MCTFFLYPCRLFFMINVSSQKVNRKVRFELQSLDVKLAHGLHMKGSLTFFSWGCIWALHICDSPWLYFLGGGRRWVGQFVKQLSKKQSVKLLCNICNLHKYHFDGKFVAKIFFNVTNRRKLHHSQYRSQAKWVWSNEAGYCLPNYDLGKGKQGRFPEIMWLPCCLWRIHLIGPENTGSVPGVSEAKVSKFQKWRKMWVRCSWCS